MKESLTRVLSGGRRGSGIKSGQKSESTDVSTIFGIACAVAAAVAAICLELILLSFGHSPSSTWEQEIVIWRSFTRWLLALLIVSPLLMKGFALSGSFAVAELSSRFTSLFIVKAQGAEGHNKLRNIVSSMQIFKKAGPGGKWDIDDGLLDILQDEFRGMSSVVWYLVIFVIAAAQAGLLVAQRATLVQSTLMSMVTYRIVVVLSKTCDLAIHTFIQAGEIATDDHALLNISRVLKIAFGTFGALFVLQNQGFDVSATLTGIGATGLILGLSTQAVLPDVFAWAVLLVQKPFVTGDCISFGSSDLGTVERVGFMFTRIRSFTGESTIYSNKNILGACINNFTNTSADAKRRMDLNFELSALTKASQLEMLTDLARDAVQSQEHCEFQICWMEETTDWGFKFTLRYWVDDYNVDLARMANTKIWTQLLKSFEEKSINLAGADRMQRRGPKHS